MTFAATATCLPLGLLLRLRAAAVLQLMKQGTEQSLAPSTSATPGSDTFCCRLEGGWIQVALQQQSEEQQGRVGNSAVVHKPPRPWQAASSPSSVASPNFGAAVTCLWNQSGSQDH